MKNEIGVRIRILRKRLGLTQAQLARQLGITGAAISSYELGDVPAPLEVIDSLVMMAGTTYDWIMSGKELIDGEWVERIYLDHDESHLIEEYRASRPEYQKLIIQVAETAAKASLK